MYTCLACCLACLLIDICNCFWKIVVFGASVVKPPAGLPTTSHPRSPLSTMDNLIPSPGDQEEIRSAGILEPNHRIFLSHSGAQKTFVEDLYEGLKARDHYPFFDRSPSYHRTTGPKFGSLISEALEDLTVAVVVSVEFCSSIWSMIELATFHEAQRKGNPGLKILPLFFDLSTTDLDEPSIEDRWMPMWKEHVRTHHINDPTLRLELNKWSAALTALREVNGLILNNCTMSEASYRSAVTQAIFQLSPPHWSYGISRSVANCGQLCEIPLDQFVDDPKTGTLQLHLYGPSGSGKSTMCSRLRTRNWTAEEIYTMLKVTEEAPGVNVGFATWGYVSENLWEQYGFDRDSISCENMWSTLLHGYRAWEMDEDQRSSNKMPRTFDLKWYEMIDRILKTKILQKDADLLSSVLSFWQFQSSASGMGHVGSADCDKVVSGDSSDDCEEFNTESEDDGSSGDSIATFESQSEATADSHIPNTTQSHEPCCATGSNSVGRKRKKSAFIFDDDMQEDLISRVAPFVNIQIEGALKLFISVLRGQKEDELKRQEKFLAIKEQKLALKREKMQLLSRHGAPSSLCNSAIQLRSSMLLANSMGLNNVVHSGTQRTIPDGVASNVDQENCAEASASPRLFSDSRTAIGSRPDN